ncbi:hypothetical protein NDU88_001671 [Pleurodeles waltl]|uniref:Uncharacterized protein n=1 Tax=Pleurodeles waltl TaxID=8319 RepID=A0AAV7M156_PLEWA|nr:hypothetical protein NDU88_001671 [Pleurodeles waltl]
MSVHAKESRETVDPKVLRELPASWGTPTAQFLQDNANSLMRIDPKLTELASAETDPFVNGLLFENPFAKDLEKCVNTFNALDKAQSSLKRIFSQGLFAGPDNSQGDCWVEPFKATCEDLAIEEQAMAPSPA